MEQKEGSERRIKREMKEGNKQTRRKREKRVKSSLGGFREGWDAVARQSRWPGICFIVVRTHPENGGKS